MRRTLLVGISALLSIGMMFALNAASDDAPPAEKSLTEELPRIPPRDPKQALQSFRAQADFTMDLIAAEPLVTDPVAAAYDEDGRLFVVEMGGYPFENERGLPPTGLVRLLQDADGDGKFDRADTYADKLACPTGIALYDGGAFVLSPPDLWYLKDTDGDNRADVRKKVFTGFGTKNIQALANNLIWGIDHKIYGATAGNGGNIITVDDPGAKAVSVNGMDFCFDPKTKKFEAISGTAQFGNTFDDWHDRFVCSNSDHAQMIVLPSRYLARNPYLPVPAVIKSIGKEGGASPVFRTSSAEPWRLVRTRRRAASVERSKYAATELVPIGFFTSATGITVYRGDAYPKEYHGNLFIGDVGGNLIHRKRLEPNGAIFDAVRADEKVEFVTSTDNWFRPVNFVNAPDGTLHVLDMYRETIEHPWSIPDDIKAHLDLESGRDLGRIYRLTPPGFRVPPPPKLGKAPSAELVQLLESPNGWKRETAHRLLWERQDNSVVDKLRMLLKSRLPQGSLHALWTLEGIGSLSNDDLADGLKNESPRVREHALVLSEKFLNGAPSMLGSVLALADDADARVRMQVAFSLGEVCGEPEKVAAGLTRILVRDAADPWIRTAVMSSALDAAPAVLRSLFQNDAFVASGQSGAVFEQLAVVIGGRNRKSEIADVLAAVEQTDAVANRPAMQQQIVVGLAEGLARSRASLGALVADPSSPSAKMIERILATAIETAGAPEASIDDRRQAIGVLQYGRFDRVVETLAALLDAKSPGEVQLAAVRSLSTFSVPQVVKLLIEAWPVLTPSVRGEAIEAMMARPERVTAYLDAVEKGTISARDLLPARRDFLTNHQDAAIRSRAKRLLGSAAPSPRSEVIRAYQPALGLKGKAEQGQRVFERECVACHRLGSKGNEVGPNLATIINRTPDALMIQILDPNREVLPNYVEYFALLDDGRTITGLIAAETPTSITLKRAEGASDTILRQNLEAIRASGKSLMPEGLEQKIGPQDMADLLAFLLDLK